LIDLKSDFERKRHPGLEVFFVGEAATILGVDARLLTTADLRDLIVAGGVQIGRRTCGIRNGEGWNDSADVAETHRERIRPRVGLRTGSTPRPCDVGIKSAVGIAIMTVGLTPVGSAIELRAVGKIVGHAEWNVPRDAGLVAENL